MMVARVREGRARDGELLGGLMDWAGGRIGKEDIFDGEAGVWGFGDLMFEAGAGGGGRKDGMKGGWPRGFILRVYVWGGGF